MKHNAIVFVEYQGYVINFILFFFLAFTAGLEITLVTVQKIVNADG